MNELDKVVGPGGEVSEIKPELTIFVEPLAVPYRAIFENVPYTELRTLFDAYWAAKGSTLIEKLKIKTRKGKKGAQPKAQSVAESSIGLKKLYSEPLCDWLVAKLKREKEIEVLHIENMELYDFEPDKKAILVMRYYQVPNLELSELVLEMPKPDYGTPEEMYERYLIENRRRGRTWRKQAAGEAVATNAKVCVDMTTTQNGEVVAKYSFHPGWISLEEYPSREIVERIRERKVGDSFSVSWVGLEAAPLVSEVLIVEAEEPSLPPVDEAFAKSLNFDSLELLKEDFYKKFEEQSKESTRKYIIDTVIDRILTQSNLPPLPERWLDLRAERGMELYVEGQGGLKNALAVSHSPTKETLLNRFKQQAYREYLQKLAIRGYIRKFGLPVDNEAKIFEHMSSQVKWVEPKVES